MLLGTTGYLITVMKTVLMSWLLANGLLSLNLHTCKLLLEAVLLGLDLLHVIFAITISLTLWSTIRYMSD